MNCAYNLNRQTDRQTDRQYGIDLLRVIAMIMIPVLHILGHGGIIQKVIPMSLHYFFIWILEILAYCAVDVFALISGYIGYKRNFSYKRIVIYCLQVMFYTVSTTVFIWFYAPNLLNIKEILKAIFPYIYGTYWYFTAYFCLLFFIPYINILTQKISKDHFFSLIVSLFLVFSVLPTVFHADPANIKHGYSFLWLATLYLVGSYIKKYDIDKMLTPIISFIGYLLCCIITFLSKFFIDFITFNFLGKPKFGNIFVSYVSPTILIAAVFLLIACSNIKVNNFTRKFLEIFAPASFGVYLLHEEPLIRQLFITNRFAYFLEQPSLITCTLVIFTALIIWLIGSCIDIVRSFVFKKLHLENNITKLMEHIGKATEKTLRNINIRL